MKKLFENWQKHLNEGAVPHSAEHVVNKMRETGLSAKEALKILLQPFLSVEGMQNDSCSCEGSPIQAFRYLDLLSWLSP